MDTNRLTLDETVRVISVMIDMIAEDRDKDLPHTEPYQAARAHSRHMMFQMIIRSLDKKNVLAHRLAPHAYDSKCEWCNGR